MSTALPSNLRDSIPTPAEAARCRELLHRMMENQYARAFHACNTRPQERVNALKYALELLDNDQAIVEQADVDRRAEKGRAA